MLVVIFYFLHTINGGFSPVHAQKYSNSVHQAILIPTTPEPTSTSRKILHNRDGWKPIITERKFLARPTLHSSSPTIKTIAEFFQYHITEAAPYKLKEKIISQTNFTSDASSKLRNPNPLPTVSKFYGANNKKSTILKEDDLMFMQYGPATSKSFLKFQQRKSDQENSEENSDMMMQERSLQFTSNKQPVVPESHIYGSNTVAITPRSSKQQEFVNQRSLFSEKSINEDVKQLNDMHDTNNEFINSINLVENGHNILRKPIVVSEDPNYITGLFESFATNSGSPKSNSTKKHLVIGNKFGNTDNSGPNLAVSPNSTFKGISNCSSSCPHSSTIINRKDEALNFASDVLGDYFTKMSTKGFKFNVIPIKRLFSECYSADVDKKSSLGCLKKIVFKMLDKAITSNIIKLSDTVSLVMENSTNAEASTARANIIDDPDDWFSSFIEKLHKLLSTHSLKIELLSKQDETNSLVEGRRRHAFNRAFPVLTAIYITITAVLIPLVFQFMAIIGGKAFIISKIAVMFALVTCFSKLMATSHEIPSNHHHHQQPPTPHLYYAQHYQPQQTWRRSSDHTLSSKLSPIEYQYSYYSLE